ncbi:MAG: hypothetical protein HY255_00235 [Betaproteobacteria bacterium]|nr:hypothetical protein [Betaproteobacteria bacterium]
MRKQDAIRAHIRQLSCLGVTAESAMPTLLRSIRQLVPCDSAGFFWVDAKGDMTHLFAERMLAPDVMNLYFERHYDGPEFPFRKGFLKRAKASEIVTSGAPDTKLLNSAYYDEILRTLDAYHVLHAVIRDQGDALGLLSLYRDKASKAFEEHERQDIGQISKYVAHAVRRPIAIDDAHKEDGIEGLVVVSASAEIRSGNASSLLLLSKATHGLPGPKSLPLVAGSTAPAPIPHLITMLQEAMLGGDCPPPRVQQRTVAGTFEMSAYALTELRGKATEIAIHIRPRESQLLRFADAMLTIDMPLQQREVALAIVQGKSNVEIAEALNISRNTASYHVKQLFARLDAHDRASVMARILAGSGK